jgi:hypothetical protein
MTLPYFRNTLRQYGYKIINNKNNLFNCICIILRGRWCDIIVLNIHAPTEDKTDDLKDTFHEELEHIFDKFLK